MPPSPRSSPGSRWVTRWSSRPSPARFRRPPPGPGAASPAAASGEAVSAAAGAGGFARKAGVTGEIIRLVDGSKVYGSGDATVHAVGRVSLSVKEGDFL